MNPSLTSSPTPRGGEFWDTHDTTDYPGAFRTVRVVAELRNRHYEIPIDADVIKTLEARARKSGVTLGRLASDLLRRTAKDLRLNPRSHGIFFMPSVRSERVAGYPDPQ